jgi:hypothetical protein
MRAFASEPGKRTSNVHQAYEFLSVITSISSTLWHTQQKERWAGREGASSAPPSLSPSLFATTVTASQLICIVFSIPLSLALALPLSLSLSLSSDIRSSTQKRQSDSTYFGVGFFVGVLRVAAVLAGGVASLSAITVLLCYKNTSKTTKEKK